MCLARNRLVAVLFAALAMIHGCGGGGGGGAAPAPGASTATPPSPNVQPISVDAGLVGTVNLVYTSVVLCAPGSGNCQSVDNVVIDTGSSGLRILASALGATLALAQQTDATGDAVLECARFVDGYTWGPVKRADLRIAGEQANALSVQIIGDPQFSALVPDACAANGPSRNSVRELRANGILGLAIFPQDCGPACARSGSPGMYYACTESTCRAVAMPLDQQLQQPVSKFAVNNNGVIIDLPAVPATGAAKVSGSLVFGIGTQANNVLGNATVIGVDSNSGTFTTIYNGTSYGASFLDSGSNAFFFADAGTPVCTDRSVAGFYCPAATQHLTATIQGRNGRSAPVNFELANAQALVAGNPGAVAFPNLGAPQIFASSFDWGLPFFYGRNVYVAIDGASTPAGPGPYIAF